MNGLEYYWDRGALFITLVVAFLSVVNLWSYYENFWLRYLVMIVPVAIGAWVAIYFLILPQAHRGVGLLAAVILIFSWTFVFLPSAAFVVPMPQLLTLWPLIPVPIFMIVRWTKFWQYVDQYRFFFHTYVPTALVSLLALIVAGLVQEDIISIVDMCEIDCESLFSQQLAGDSSFIRWLPQLLSVCWLVYVAGAWGFHIRGVRRQMRIAKAVYKGISQIDALDNLWNECARVIRTQLPYKGIVLTANNPITGNVSIRGGESIEQLSSIYPESVIAQQVIESQSLVNIKNIQWYEQKQEIDKVSGSILAVPIIQKVYGGENRILGILELQDEVAFAFARTDEQLSEHIASIIGSELGHLFETASRLQSITNEINGIEEPDGIVATIARQLRTFYDVSAVVIFRLGIGNGILLPGPLFSGDSWDHDFWKRQFFDTFSNDVNDWIGRSQTRFITPDYTDEQSRHMLSAIHTAEGAKTLVWLLVGTHDTPRYVLCLIFRGVHQFNLAFKSELDLLTRTVTPFIDRAVSYTIVFKNFGSSRLDLHHIFGVSELGRGAWERSISKIRNFLHHLPENVTEEEHQRSLETTEPLPKHGLVIEHLDALEKGLGIFMELIRVKVATQTPLFESRNLEQALNQDVYAPLGQQFQSVPASRIDPRIEQVSIELRLVLYRLIGEAVVNAYVHGKVNGKSPQSVTIRLICEHDHILVRVTDDGVGFDPQRAMPGPDGIFHLLERIRQYVGAHYSWEGTGIGRGTRLTVMIPILPQQFI